MKDNTQATKEYLQRALANLPDDFALQEIRQQLKSALQRIEHVEKKREKREQQNVPTQTWHEMINNGVQNPYTPIRTIDIINQMIAEEKKNLQEIQARKNKAQNPLNLPSDDGPGTLLG